MPVTSPNNSQHTSRADLMSNNSQHTSRADLMLTKTTASGFPYGAFPGRRRLFYTPANAHSPVDFITGCGCTLLFLCLIN